MVNRWLGRAPQDRDELRRLQVCCDSIVQCKACPFRPHNRDVPLKDLAREVFREQLRR